MNEIWPKDYEKLVSYAEDKHKNSIYVSEENNCKHKAINGNRDYVNHIKIDGKVIPRACRDTKRIDFLLLNETKKTAYFIELKGSHIKDAFEQLEVTDKHLKPLLEKYVVQWRIICHSRTTSLRTNEVTKYCRKHPCLIIHKTPMEEHI
ncbi:MAG: hypothetical protein ILA30_05185 [Selenomonas sp.]|nr:hypothetical protein [Selenomonas sp.]